MDDRVIPLLEEIRDLQRQQVQNSALALERQAEGVRRQTEALARARRAQRAVWVALALIIAVVVVISVVEWAYIWHRLGAIGR